MSCNTGTYWWYIEGYQVDRGKIILLFIMIPKNIFRNGISQHEKNSAMSLSVSEVPEEVLHYQKILNEVEWQLFEKLATEILEGEDIYIYIYIYI